MEYSTSGSDKPPLLATLYYATEGPEAIATNTTVEGLDGTTIGVRVPILSARRCQPSPTLETAGFQLVRQVSGISYSDFQSATTATAKRKTIQTEYYNEMSALVCGVTGAAQCIPMHFALRSADPGQRAKRKIEPPAMAVHCDYTVKTSLHFYDTLKPQGMRAGGRFMVINAWRSISPTPVSNHHLACCDATSVVAPDDFIPFSFRSPVSGDVVNTYRLDAGHFKSHRWFYYPGMSSDEVLLFVQYDSDPRSKCRYTFHSAFEDSTADPKVSTPRESIEVRMVAFFPDAEFDSIPSLIQSGDAITRRLAHKALSVMGHVDSWEASLRQWGHYVLYQPNGTEKLLRGILKDDLKPHNSDDGNHRNGRIGDSGGGSAVRTHRGTMTHLQAEGAVQAILAAGEFEAAARRALPGTQRSLHDASVQQVLFAVDHGHGWDQEGQQFAKTTLSTAGGVRVFVTFLVQHLAGPKGAAGDPLKGASPKLQEQVIDAIVSNPTFEQRAKSVFL